LYGKNEKTASTEFDFIQKRRKILPNRDQWFEDESSIFLTSIKCFKRFRKFRDTSKMVKIVFSYHSQAIFFNLKKQSAEFWNWIGSLDAKHKKKTKKCVGLASYATLRGWWKSWFLKNNIAGFMTLQPPVSMTLLPVQNFCNNFFFGPLGRNKNHKNLDIESFRHKNHTN
jgi:hypothetical protein